MKDRAAGRSKVVIVGAGIGGLSAHLAFARAGFRKVAHYERRSELGPAGAGIVIWPDRVKVLRTLRLGERLAAIGNRPDVLEVRGPDGRPLSELPVAARRRTALLQRPHHGGAWDALHPDDGRRVVPPD